MIKQKIKKSLKIQYVTRKLKSNFHDFDFNNIPKNEKFEFGVLLVLLTTKINCIKLKKYFKNKQNSMFFKDYFTCLDNVYKNNDKLDFNKLYSELKINTKNLSTKVIDLLQISNKESQSNTIENLIVNGILYFYIDKNIGKFNIDPFQNIKDEKQYQQNVDFNILKIQYLKEIKKSLMSLIPRDFNDMIVYIMQLTKKHI